MLEAAVAAGLAAAGTDVLLLGVLPTPGVAFLTDDLDADLGVMISASHNPMPDNGIKIFGPGGRKLDDATEDAIEARMSLGAVEPLPSGAAIGRINSATDAKYHYLEHLVRSVAHPLDGLTVVAAVAGDVNLGIREIGGDTAVTRTALFVDSRATGAQRDALVAMAKQYSNGVIDKVVQLTPTAIQFANAPEGVRVSTDSLRLTIGKEMSHDPTCGGKQWFHPFATVDGAEMGTAKENTFTGTTLGTKWSDPNKRSAFFGTFSY